MTDRDFEVLYQKADAAGRAAVENATIIPMTVGSFNGPTYFVEDGVCGFAWVNIKPGTSKFARWLKKTGKGRTDSYYGGITIWISEFNQSMQKKEAYARAFAEVLRDAGFKAYANSRMD